MATTFQTFDDHLSAFKNDQETPWGRLRYGIASANLRRHLDEGSLALLDAGGGIGLDSIPFAVQGHHVTLLDFSREMLVEARRNAEASGVTKQMTFLQSDVAAIPTLFPEPAFDVVLCHNVIQYVDDVTATLRAICHAMKPGGLISILSVNRYSEAFKSACQNLDLEAAYASLDSSEIRMITVGVNGHCYSSEEMRDRLSEVGCSVIGEYGVRCVCDYIANNEIKSDPTFFSHLEQLEYALTDRYPYKLLARYFQVIARKASA